MAAVAGCAPKEMGPVGVSHGSAVAPTASARDAGVARPAPLIPADYRTAFKRLNRARFMSKGGHSSDRFALEVFGNAAAQRVPYEAGATLIAEHYDRTGTGDKLVSWLMMEKRPRGYDPDRGDWRYVMVDADGTVQGDGKVDRCAWCHEQAEHDHVFPILD